MAAVGVAGLLSDRSIALCQCYDCSEKFRFCAPDITGAYDKVEKVALVGYVLAYRQTRPFALIHNLTPSHYLIKL